MPRGGFPIEPSANPFPPVATSTPEKASSPEKNSPTGKARTPETANRERSSDPAAHADVELAPPEARDLAGEWLADLQSEIQEEPLPGQPWSLVALLERAAGTRTEVAATVAYWKLAAAAAEVTQRQREHHRLRALTEQAQADPALAQATAEALLAYREARLHVRLAQLELAQFVRLAPREALPLPADLPLTGVYRTRFEEIFRQRIPPKSAIVMQQTIPLRFEVLQLRTRAVRAAQDDLEALVELVPQGHAGWANLLAAERELGRQQRALLEAVQQYNEDIATYALPLAGESAPAELLASMLIKPGPRTGAPQEHAPGGIEGHDFQEDRLPQPTRDMPREVSQQVETRLERLASRPSPAVQTAGGFAGQSSGPRSGAQRVGFEEPAATFPGIGSAPGSGAPHEGPSAQGLYTGLKQSSAETQLRELVGILHWDRGLPEMAGQAISLPDALGLVTPDKRHELTRAYWQAAEQLARFQALSAAVEQVQTLRSDIWERRREPTGPRAMLAWHVCALETQAELLACQADSLEAQSALSDLAGQPLRGAWLRPSTSPHAGGFQPRLQAQGPAQSQSRQLAAIVARLQHVQVDLQVQAAELVQLDTVRAGLAAEYATRGQDATRGQGLDAILSATRRQTASTRELLATLTLYNEQIADYVFQVLPASLPAGTVVRALVVQDTPESN